MKGWLPDSHKWESCLARKEKNKSRVMGGLVIGRRKGWRKEGSKLKIKEEEGIVLEIMRGTEKLC